MTLTQCIDGLMGSSTNAAPRPRFDDSMFDVLSGIRLFPAHRGLFGSRGKALPDTNRAASVALQENPHAFPNPSHSAQAFHGFSHSYLSRLPIIVLPAGVMYLAAGGN